MTPRFTNHLVCLQSRAFYSAHIALSINLLQVNCSCITLSQCATGGKYFWTNWNLAFFPVIIDSCVNLVGDWCPSLLSLPFLPSLLFPLHDWKFNCIICCLPLRLLLFSCFLTTYKGFSTDRRCTSLGRKFSIIGVVSLIYSDFSASLGPFYQHDARCYCHI